MKAANQDVERARKSAAEWLAKPDSMSADPIIEKLEAAIGTADATKGVESAKRTLKTVRQRVLRKRAARTLALALESIKSKETSRAEGLLEKYIRDENSTDIAATRKLLKELRDAHSEEAARKAVSSLTDAELQGLSERFEIPPRIRPSRTEIVPILLVTLLQETERELSVREAKKKEALDLAEKKREAEMARLAALKKSKPKDPAKPTITRLTPLQKGVQLLLKKDYPAAHEVFTTVLSADPTNTDARYLRGKSTVARYWYWRDRNRYTGKRPTTTVLKKAAEESVEDLTAAVNAVPNDGERYYQL